MTRTLNCKKEVGEGEYNDLPEGSCKDAIKPPVTEACNVDIICKVSNTSNDPSHSTMIVVNFKPHLFTFFLISREKQRSENDSKVRDKVNLQLESRN